MSSTCQITANVARGFPTIAVTTPAASVNIVRDNTATSPTGFSIPHATGDPWSKVSSGARKRISQSPRCDASADRPKNANPEFSHTAYRPDWNRSRSYPLST
jgi:hypothetical protein